jgi:hypothetical protein
MAIRAGRKRIDQRIANAEAVQSMKRTVLARSLLVALNLGLLAEVACAQEREWSFDTGEEDAYLIFGVPETDDVGVSFWCTIGMGEIRLFIPEAGESLRAGQTVKIDLDVGGKQFTLTAETAANEEAGSTSADARVETSNPIFAAFLAGDRFSVKIGKEVSVFPLQGADFQSLLHVCSPQ